MTNTAKFSRCDQKNKQKNANSRLDVVGNVCKIFGESRKAKKIS